MNQRRFDVKIGKRLIEQVYFASDMSALDVRRSLIERDGMSNQISVYRNNESCTAYDSVARLTHPEELK